MCPSPLQCVARPRLLFVRLYGVQTKRGGVLTQSRQGRRGGGGETQGVCSLTPAARHRPFFTFLRECMCLSIPPSNRPQMPHAGAMFPSCQLGRYLRPGGRRRHTGEEKSGTFLGAPANFTQTNSQNVILSRSRLKLDASFVV